MRVRSALFLVGFLATFSSGDAQKNPVEQVVKLMDKLLARITDESQTEAAAYDKFACFCKEQADEKFYSITKKTERINILHAAIKKATADIEALTLEMNEATKQKTALEAEAKACDEKSAKDRAAYQTMHDNIVTALAQLDRAIEAIKESTDLTNDDMLLQIGGEAGRLVAEERRKVEAERAAQAPHAYENKGGKTLVTLEKIKAKFTLRLKTIEGWEDDRQHAVNMEQQARRFEITAQSKLITKCQNSIGAKSAQKSSDEGEKSSLESDRSDDQAFLDKLTEECEEKAEKWDARSQRRVGEIKAMSEALVILKGDATAKYSANKLALRQGSTAVSFLQVSSVSQSRAVAEKAAKAAVAAALEKRASAAKNSQLFAFAMLLKDSPFDSVKNMIEELIDKIDAEQAAEEDEIEDCKKDIVDATRKKSKNKGKIEDEEAKIIELGSQINFDTNEIKDLESETSKLYQGLKEATTLRDTESANNAMTLKDATAGKASIDKAIAVLKEFYEAEYTPGLLQVRKGGARREPDIGAPDAAGFLGDEPDADPAAQGEGQGIFGLLMTIQEDYQKTIDKVTQEEGDAKTEYDDFKSTTEADITDKKDSKASKEASNRKAADDTEQARNDLEEWTKQKDEAIHELSVLEPRCLGLGASAEERKKRREEEKKALRDAIGILETMAPAAAPEPSTEDFLQRRAARRA